MADKKLNEVPVVSDIVTIFGKRSNGEIVQIDKSNLATLLGGLMNNLKLFPFMYREVILNKTDDLSGYVDTGMYEINNVDSGLPFKFGGLIVFKCGSQIIQIASRFQSTECYIRTAWSNYNFYAWGKISII